MCLPLYGSFVRFTRLVEVRNHYVSGKYDVVAVCIVLCSCKGCILGFVCHPMCETFTSRFSLNTCYEHLHGC